MKDLLLQLIYKTSSGRNQAIKNILKRNNIPYMLQKNKYAENIIVFPENLNKLVFTAHYDIVPMSCGANDNGASLAILLKTAIKIKDSAKVSIVFLDREECGGYGCDLFLKDYKPAVMINMDMCGCGENIVMLDEVSENNPYLNLLTTEAPTDTVWTDNLPYCDSRHAWSLGADVWTICLFPTKDKKYMESVKMSPEEKRHIKNRDIDSKTLCKILAKHSAPHKLEIIQYMHNGPKDDPSYINFDMMEKIYDYVEHVATNN